MEPTIADGQVVWVFQWAYLFRNPQVGEIVIFRLENEELVKRVVGVEKELYRLGGDNQNDSFDSRKFGLVGKRDILGKVIGKQNGAF